MSIVVPVASVVNLKINDELYSEVVDHLINQGQESLACSSGMKIQCLDADNKSRFFCLSGNKITNMLDERTWTVVDDWELV